MRSWVFLALFLALPLSAKPLTQIQAFNCDIDDNILVTPARIMLWDVKKKREKGVSTGDWAFVKNQLGKDLSIRPNGLRYFGDTTKDGKLLFKKQIEKMLEAKDDSWKGLSWNAFVIAMSNEETRKRTTLITARQHSPEAILEGLKVLYDRGILPGLPDLENIYPVGYPGFDKNLIGADSAESKSKVMLKLLDEIEATAVPSDATLVESADGTKKAKLHLWGFSDDDYDNFAKARDVLLPQVAKGRWPHIKIVLYFTGRNHPTETPHSIVLKPDGTTRPTVSTEATRMGLPKRIKRDRQAALDTLYKVCSKKRSGL